MEQLDRSCLGVLSLPMKLLLTRHRPQKLGLPPRLSVPWWISQRQPYPHSCPFYQIRSSRPVLLG